MIKTKGVIAAMETTSLTVAVTGTPGGAGVAVSSSVASSSVVVTNTSNGAAIEYKLGAGAWLKLMPSDGIELPLDLSATALAFRRAWYDGGLATARLVVASKPTLSTSEGGLAIPTGGAIAAVVTGTGIVGDKLTATLPTGVVGTLQFTKTLKASPFTKSNIAGAVANAVNSLQYTMLLADVPYNFACDSSNTVSTSNSIAAVAASTGGDAATALTLTGPTTGTVNVASAVYTVSLSPTGGTVASPVTATPTPVTGVTFSPATLTLTNGSPSGTFTATATTSGTKTIGVNNDGGLTAPATITLAVAAAATSTANAIVSTAQFPTATTQIPTDVGSQVPHFASADGDISNLVFTDVRGYIPDTMIAAAAGSQPVSLRKFVEYPVGTFTPVLYGGVQTYDMSTAVLSVTSDPVAGLTIPAGAQWFEHTINVRGTNIDMPTFELPAGSSTLGTLHNKYTATGGVPAHQSAGTVSALYFGAALITGTVAASGVKSVGTFGDSINFGEGDVSSVGAKGSSGYLGRMLDKTARVYVKFAKRGMSASDLVAMLAGANQYLDPYFAKLNVSLTHVINQYGVNDLRLGRTQTQLFADYQTIYSKFPGKSIAQTTITNRTASTDAYVTTANQTARTDGNWAALPTVNTGIRAGLANVTAVIDASDASSTARNSGIWPAPPAPTGDGTHPGSYMAGAMATALTYTPA